MKQLAKVAFLAALDCSAARTRSRRHRGAMSADEPTLMALARDILAVEAAAKAGETIDGVQTGPVGRPWPPMLLQTTFWALMS